MNVKKTLGVALLAAGLAVGQAAAADLWIHLKVDGRDEQVAMNLPISMVRSLGAMIPDEAYSSGRVRVRDKDYSVAELRRIWRELQNGPDATYISVDDADSKVRIGKRGGYLELRAVDRGGDGETVDAKIPLPVMAALLSGSGDQLNIGAALDELARFGEGELMTVTGRDETVRIWVSDRSEER